LREIDLQLSEEDFINKAVKTIPRTLLKATMGEFHIHGYSEKFDQEVLEGL